MAPAKTTCYTASRLTATTFKIVQDDSFNEQPFIYLKLFPAPHDDVTLLVDTGCGKYARDSSVQVKDLREFIETFPVDDNAQLPLNPGGARSYVVVCSHVHYDHICGIEQFSDSTLVASGYDPSFITNNKPAHSLCKYLDIPTPQYEITHWAGDNALLPSPRGGDLPIRALHVPGHTPDSLALYDEVERMLYVGDTLYEWAPTIFPMEGNIVDWLKTVERLLAFVCEKEANGNTAVSISCGHITAGGPAREILQECYDFMLDILGGRIEVAKRMKVRGYTAVVYEQPGTQHFVVLAPEKLVDEARVSR